MPTVLDRTPIRWRLALISAGLTFAILCVFAVVIGELTARRIRNDFTNQLVAQTDDLASRLRISVVGTPGGEKYVVQPDLNTYAAPEHAVIRIIPAGGGVPLKETRGAPELGFPVLSGVVEIGDYRVASRSVTLIDAQGERRGAVSVQYARRLSDLEATVRRVRAFLIFGVLGGTAIALLGGVLLARRAMAPVAALTSTAREIARTRDPNRRVPVPDAEDEVAVLARTLDEMLRSLEESRAESQAALERQRQFVADASHELRTPLTSVLANLEILTDVLEGERAEAAESALRSTRRMRRLVADLLLLARADAGSRAPHAPVDLAQVAVDAAAELGPVAGEHRFAIDAQPVMVDGSRDDLHRLALNLMENALRHTPPDTAVEVRVHAEGPLAVLDVEDDGPGIEPELREQLFERFVRGAGDRGGSFGLGLSIVRAVAEGHGGTVTLEDPLDGVGARFVVRMPAISATDPADRPRAHAPGRGES